MNSYQGKSVLVVSHGGVMRALLVHLGFGTHDELPRNAVNNLGYIVLEKNGHKLKILETHGITKQITSPTDHL